MKTLQTSDENNPTSYKKDFIIGVIITALIVFVGISVCTSESSKIIISFPIFLLAISATVAAEIAFIAAISKIRYESLTMDVKFMDILFNVGALQQQLIPVADGDVKNDARD